jgi:ABC-type amino acid transport system permease subunit
MVIYFGAAAMGWKIQVPFMRDFNSFFWGLLCLILNSSAYVAEIVRSGIGAVNAGQIEAARSLGMSHVLALRLVILPQAVRNILPAMMNEFVAIIKETSIVSLVGISELMFRAKDVVSISYRTLEPYVIAALLYFIMVYPLSRLVRYLERRLNESVTR